MADFVTPGRQSHGQVGGGSSSRRVVRSALETLLESQSPYLPVSDSGSPRAEQTSHGQRQESGGDSGNAPPAGVPQHPAPPKGFTVSYAARTNSGRGRGGGGARAASVPVAGENDRLIASRVGRSVQVEQEPSALLFLSPSSGGGGDDVVTAAATVDSSSRRRRAPSAAAMAKAGNIAKRTQQRNGEEEEEGGSRQSTAPAPVLAPSPDPSRSLLQEVEQADEPAEGMRTGTAASSVKVYSEEELHHRLREALASYEKQRDDEEAAVLTQIDKEMGERTEAHRRLLAEKDEVMQVAKSLQAELTRVVQQCEELERQSQVALEERQRLRDALGRAEVELSHTKDALRIRERQDDQQVQSASKLEGDVAALTAQVAAKDAALATAQQQYMAECEDIKRNMTSLGQCMTEMETTLAQKDDTIAQLKQRLAEVDKNSSTAATREQRASEALTRRVAELEELLQAQTDEVRRRMARTTALEADKKALKQHLAELVEAVNVSGGHHAALQKELEAILARVKAHMRALTAKAKEPVSPTTTTGAATSSSSHSPPPPPQRLGLDTTNPFDSSDEEGDEASLSASLTSLSGEDVGDGDGEGVTTRLRQQQRQQGRGRSSSSSRTAKLSLFSREKRTAHHSRRRAISAPVTAGPAATTAPTSRETAATTEAAVKALRQGCASSMRVARGLATTTDLYGHRVRRKLASFEKAAAAQANATAAAEDAAQRLETACRYLKAKLAESEQDAAETKAECTAMGRDLALLEAEADRAQAEKQTLEALVKEMEAAKVEGATAHEALEQEVLHLHQQLQEATAAVRGLEEDKATLAAKLAVAEETASKVPALHEGKLSVEQTLAKEQAAVARLTERLKRAEEEKAASSAEADTLKEKLAAAHSQLEAARTQQAAQRAKENRDVQHAAAEARRLATSLESARAECADLRGLLAREKAAAEDAYKAKEAQVATLVEAARTHKGQLADLAREMELRRSGEHATLHAILDAIRAATGTAGDGDGDEQDSSAQADDAQDERRPSAGGTTTTAADADADALSSSLLPGGAGASLGSTPGASPAAAVRVALLPDSLSSEKKRRRRGGGEKPAALAVAGTGRKKGTALLRKETMQAVQRTILKLARLQEVVAAAHSDQPQRQPRYEGHHDDTPNNNSNSNEPVTAFASERRLMDSFQRAERLAREAVHRSAPHLRHEAHAAFLSSAANSPFPAAKAFASSGSGAAFEEWDEPTANAGAVHGDVYFDSHFTDRGMAGQQTPTLLQRRRPQLPPRSSPSPSPRLPSYGRASLVDPAPAHDYGSRLSHPIQLYSLFPNQASFVAKHTSLPPSPHAAGGIGGGLSSSPPSSRSRGASAGGGDVDGSCCPARPPLLRVASTN